ncbi:hypothetical protein Bpfe_011665, partial [Biomphalaria pfeifferi]
RPSKPYHHLHRCPANLTITYIEAQQDLPSPTKRPSKPYHHLHRGPASLTITYIEAQQTLPSPIVVY